MSEDNPRPRLIDFPKSLREKYCLLDEAPQDVLTAKEREFLDAQLAEANRRKKNLANDK